MALPRESGGFNLHLPVFKCSALLINRHFKEKDSLRFYNTYLTDTQNPPNLQRIPSNCPCLRLLVQELSYFPALLKQSSSSTSIHAHLQAQISRPKVMDKYPALNWKMIWSNIHLRGLSSKERSSLYMLINLELPHRSLLHRMGMERCPTCSHCNSDDETLIHKLGKCVRVRHSWEILRNKLNTVTRQRNLEVEHLIHPVLDGCRLMEKIMIIKCFIHYVEFIDECNNVIDHNALEYWLNLAM